MRARRRWRARRAPHRDVDGGAGAAAPEDLSPGRADPAVRSGAGAREFRLPVLEEIPTALPAGRAAISTTSCVEIAGEADIDGIMARADDRARDRQRARGQAENDEFNQLVLFAGLDTQPGGLAARLVPLSAPDRRRVRPGHRGRRAPPRPEATRALIGLFTAAHDPARASGRDEAGDAARAAFDDALARSRRSTTTASCA